MVIAHNRRQLSEESKEEGKTKEKFQWKEDCFSYRVHLSRIKMKGREKESELYNRADRVISRIALNAWRGTQGWLLHLAPCKPAHVFDWPCCIATQYRNDPSHLRPPVNKTSAVSCLSPGWPLLPLAPSFARFLLSLFDRFQSPMLEQSTTRTSAPFHVSTGIHGRFYVHSRIRRNVKRSRQASPGNSVAWPNHGHSLNELC